MSRSRLENDVGTVFDNVGGECSSADNDGDLGEETWLDEWVTRGGDDTRGEENRLDERVTGGSDEVRCDDTVLGKGVSGCSDDGI